MLMIPIDDYINLSQYLHMFIMTLYFAPYITLSISDSDGNQVWDDSLSDRSKS